MQKKRVILFTPLLFASLALAAGSSVERGKELFNSTTLGTNGKSCATCHAGGKMLGKAASYDEGELAGIVNQCIARTLEGKQIGTLSDDMKSLIMYIRSFGAAGKL